MASGTITSVTGKTLNLVLTWSTARIAGTRTARLIVEAWIEFTSLECAARSSQSMTLAGEAHTFGTSAINDYTGSLHRVEATSYSDGLGYNEKILSYDANGNLASQTVSASWLFNGTYSGTYLGTITASGTVTFDNIEPANTAPTWGSATATPTTQTIPETQTSIGVSWSAASDADGDTLNYYLDVSINGGAYSNIYSGTTRSYSHSIGTGNEGATYIYRVSVNDGIAWASDKRYIYTGTVTKNTFVQASLNAVSTIVYTSTIGYNDISFTSATNTQSGVTNSYKITCSTTNISMQKSTTTISSGYDLPIYVSGTVPSGPYLLFSDLKNKFGSSVGYQGTITLVLTTTNSNGTSKTSSRTVSVDLRTAPSSPTSPTISTNSTTYCYKIGETNYYIPNRRPVYVSWGAATDYLGGTCSYDVDISLDGGSSYSRIVTGTTNLYATYSTAVTSRKTTKFKITAKTSFNYSSTGAITSAIYLDYYNTPSFNNFTYTRTTTSVTATGTITLNSSIPAALTPPTGYSIKYIGVAGGASVAVSPAPSYISPTFTVSQAQTSGISADTTYTFTFEYLDSFITAIFGTARTTSITIQKYVPVFTVRTNGVGVSAIPKSSYIFSVGGDSYFSGDLETNNILPISSATYDLGSSTYKWKDIFASNDIRSYTKFTVLNKDNSSASMALDFNSDIPRLRIGGAGDGSNGPFEIQFAGDAARLRLSNTGHLFVYGHLYPFSSATSDIGSSSVKFKAGYFSGVVDAAGGFKKSGVEAVYRDAQLARFDSNAFNIMVEGGAMHGTTTTWAGLSSYYMGWVSSGNNYKLRAGFADDADTLDGSHASAFATSGHTHSAYMPKSGGTFTGDITLGSSVDIYTASNGNGNIGTASTRFNTGYAVSWNQSSLRSSKKNATVFKKSALDKISTMDVYQYQPMNAKGEPLMWQLGVMLDECPDEIIPGEDKAAATGLDLYSYASFILVGLKEAIKKIEKLEAEVAILKTPTTRI